MNLKRSKNYSLKDYSKRVVNLLPSEVHKVSRMKIYAFLLIFMIMSGAVAFAFYEYNIIQDTKAYEDDTMYKRAIISKEQKNVANQNIVLSLGNRISVKEGILNYIFYTNRSVVDILDTFESTLNGEVYLNSLMADSYESFVISASATSHEAISYLINQLKLLKTPEGEKYFTSVFTNSISRNEDEDGNVLFLFQVDCKFEGGLYETE